MSSHVVIESIKLITFAIRQEELGREGGRGLKLSIL